VYNSVKTSTLNYIC